MYVFKNVFLKYFFHFHKIKIRHCRIIGINYCYTDILLWHWLYMGKNSKHQYWAQHWIVHDFFPQL